MTDRLHLRPQHRDMLESLLREHLPDVEVWAYGSRVNGRSHDGSDLDLVLRGPDLEEIPVDRLVDFEEALRESNIPFIVEARDWSRIPARFHREIERDYVILYDSKGSEEHTPDRWRRITLHDVTELTLSGVDKKSKLNEHYVALCNYTDVYNNSFIHADMNFMKATATEREIARCSLVAGDVIITKDSEKHDDIGVPALVREDIEGLVCGYHLAILRPRPSQVDGAYLYYALSTERVQQQFHSYANGVTRFGLRKADIGLVEFPLPPLSEQRAIAHILGTLDDRIELNRRMNETLEAMARAIFQDWFVDFGPVKAKMEGRDPYLPPEIWGLFPDALDDEGRPVGWQTSNIGKEVNVVGGSTPSTKNPAYWEKGSHHWATPKDLSKLETPVLLGTERKITDAGIKKISSGLLPVGTVLLSSRAPIGYLAITSVRTAVNQGFIAMVCKKRLPNIFVLFWCYENIGYIKDISGGSTFAEISKGAFRPLPMVVPSEPTLAAFEGIARPLYDRIVVNDKEAQLLSHSRELLLPNLISGKIRLRDAERLVGEAA